jgi:hypothetical protein
MFPVIFLLSLPSAAYAGVPQTPVLTTWEQLMAGGCDLAKSHINTPLEARVLRNIPFARGGYAFKTLPLTRMFEGDGGWYKPVPSKTVTLTPIEQACVDSLKSREAALKVAQPMTDATADWMLWHTDLYTTLRSYAGNLKLMSAPKAVEVGSGCFGDGKGGLRWLWLDAKCPSVEAECSGVVFECSQDCQCTAGIGG